MIILLVCTLALACAGVRRNEIYRPLAPIASDTGAWLGQTTNGSWELALADVTMRIAPVVIASKDTWVIGPFFAFPTFWEEEVQRAGLLRISVFVMATSEAVVSFDLSEFTVVLEDGRLLLPREAGRWIVGDREPVPIGFVALRGGQAWHGFIEYDIHTEDLTPFRLRWATLWVGDEAYRLPEIPFERDRAYTSA